MNTSFTIKGLQITASLPGLEQPVSIKIDEFNHKVENASFKEATDAVLHALKAIEDLEQRKNTSRTPKPSFEEMIMQLGGIPIPVSMLTKLQQAKKAYE